MTPHCCRACAWMALASLTLTSLAAAQDRGPDVSWLHLVQRKVSDAPKAGLGTVAPLLVDGANQPITTRAGWEKQRSEIRAAWLKFLGKMPEPRPAVKLEVLREETANRVRRALVRYEGEPGIMVEGWLLRRVDQPLDRKSPAIVALHQTTKDTIDEIAGVSGPIEMQIGLHLAQRGFVVFCPRCFLWQDAKDLPDAVEQHQKRHPQVLGMAKMLYDAQRGVDVLASLADVDSQRIGAVGHSLGAKETLYLAAFDERIKAAVASEGGLTFRSTNWDAPWYLGPAIREESFPLNHHQLVALVAPRPFLILAGETGNGAADGDRSWPLLEAAWPVWKLYVDPPRLGLLNHNRGHSIPPHVAQSFSEWLTVYLR